MQDVPIDGSDEIVPGEGQDGPSRSLRGAIDGRCRDCIYDPRQMGNWREQITICSCHSCPTWPVRAISSGQGVPDWLKARDPALVPDWFRKLPHDDAIRAIKGKS